MRFADVRALARVIEMLEVPNWDQRRALTDKLIALVAEQFQHVIDPKAGPAEQQAKLNEAHGPPTIGGPMNLENDDRIKRLLNAAQQALPPDMLAASAEPSSNLNVILKAVAAMVVQAMKELTGPPEGYEIDEEVCDDGESPDAAGVGGAPPTCHWIEWRFAGNGEWDSGYSSHSLACCAAWDHASEVEGVTTADPGVTEDRGGD